MEFSNLPFDQPDLTLAGALLERAERDAVIAYLGALEGAWDGRAGEVRAVRVRIEHGETPALDEIHRHEAVRLRMTRGR